MSLTGAFAGHHGELAQLLLDQIAFLDERISQLSARISAQLTAIRQAWGIDADGTTGPTAGASPAIGHCDLRRSARIGLAGVAWRTCAVYVS